MVAGVTGEVKLGWNSQCSQCGYLERCPRLALTDIDIAVDACNSIYSRRKEVALVSQSSILSFSSPFFATQNILSCLSLTHPTSVGTRRDAHNPWLKSSPQAD